MASPFSGSYTLSKTLDDVSSFNITGSASQSTAGENDLAQNPFDLRAEHGRSMFDARHRFVLSYQWNCRSSATRRAGEGHGARRLAGQRHHDLPAGNTVHGLRFHRSVRCRAARRKFPVSRATVRTSSAIPLAALAPTARTAALPIAGTTRPLSSNSIPSHKLASSATPAATSFRVPVTSSGTSPP